MPILEASRRLRNTIRGLGRTVTEIDNIIEERRSYREYDELIGLMESGLRYASDDTRDASQLKTYQTEIEQRQHSIAVRNPKLRYQLSVAQNWFTENIDRINIRDLENQFAAINAPLLGNFVAKITSNARGLGRIAAYDFAVTDGVVNDYNEIRQLNESLLTGSLTQEETQSSLSKLAVLQKRIPNDVGASPLFISLFQEIAETSEQIRQGINVDDAIRRTNALRSRYENANADNNTLTSALALFLPPNATTEETQKIREDAAAEIESEANSLYRMDSVTAYESKATKVERLNSFRRKAQSNFIGKSIDLNLDFNYFVKEKLGRDNASEITADELSLYKSAFLVNAIGIRGFLDNTNFTAQAKKEYKEVALRNMISIISSMSMEEIEQAYNALGGETTPGPGATLGVMRSTLIQDFVTKGNDIFLTNSRVFYGGGIGIGANAVEGSNINDMRERKGVPQVFREDLNAVLNRTASNVARSNVYAYEGQIGVLGTFGDLTTTLSKVFVSTLAVGGFNLDFGTEGDRLRPEVNDFIGSAKSNADRINVFLEGKGFGEKEREALSYYIGVIMTRDGRFDHAYATEEYLQTMRQDGNIGEDPVDGTEYFFNPAFSNSNTSVLTKQGDRIFELRNGRPPSYDESVNIAKTSNEYINDEDVVYIRQNNKMYKVVELGSPFYDADNRSAQERAGSRVISGLAEGVTVDSPTLTIQISDEEELRRILIDANTLSINNFGDDLSTKVDIYQDSKGTPSGPRAPATILGLVGKVVERDYSAEDIIKLEAGDYNLQFVEEEGEKQLYTEYGTLSRPEPDVPPLITRRPLPVGRFGPNVELEEGTSLRYSNALSYVFGSPTPPDDEEATLSGEYSNGAVTPSSPVAKVNDRNNGVYELDIKKIMRKDAPLFIGTNEGMNQARNYIRGYVESRDLTYDEFFEIRLIIEKRFGVRVMPPVNSMFTNDLEDAFPNTNFHSFLDNYYNIPSEEVSNAIREGTLQGFVVRGSSLSGLSR